MIIAALIINYLKKNIRWGFQMKKLLHFLPFILVIVILSKGCNYDNPIVTTVQNPAPTEMIMGPVDSGMYTIHMGQVFETPLITSNNVQIGKLRVWFDSSYFYFKYVAGNAYYFKNIHLAAERDRNRIPLSGNCPNIENYNYQIHNLPANTATYTFKVPYIFLRPPVHFTFLRRLSMKTDRLQILNACGMGKRCSILELYRVFKIFWFEVLCRRE